MRFLLSLALAAVAYGSPARLAERAVLIDNVSDLKNRYDYIIVGGGTSGLTVANRLSENPDVTVLVIEYGYVDGQEPGVFVPGLPTPPKYSVTYQSVPQPGLNGRTVPMYTANVVGGASLHNAMFFVRGSATDYDAWEKLGNSGWSWNSLLPYFKKFETFTPPPPELAAEYPISTDLGPHGTSGPIGSSFSTYVFPAIKYFFRGWNAVGVSSNPQPNAGNVNGAIYGTISIDANNQSRSFAASGYYRPYINKRPNWHLTTGKLVSKIQFNNEKKATGVEYVLRDTKEKRSVSVSREVILAAGAFRSPQILQLSGVGPKSLLDKIGVKTVVDLPGVGYNFQDQPTMFVYVNYTNYPFPSPDWLSAKEPWSTEQLALYNENRTGAMTSVWRGGGNACFLPLKDLTSNPADVIQAAAAVDPAIVLNTNDPSMLAGYKHQLKVLLELYGSPLSTVHETKYNGGQFIPVSVMKPLSRGSILASSSDPFVPPVVDYNTFAHPTDLDLAVLSIRKTRDFLYSAPMQELGTVELRPGTNIVSDQDLANSIRDFATGTWAHPVGTLSMMRREHGGVVDPDLNVYGVSGVRAVDASVMPLIPATHTSSPVYAVAEKAADLIKKRW